MRPTVTAATRQARRILNAWESLDHARIREELQQARQLCSQTVECRLDQERREALDSVVRNLQTAPSGAALRLLKHLSTGALLAL